MVDYLTYTKSKFIEPEEKNTWNDPIPDSCKRTDEDGPYDANKISDDRKNLLRFINATYVITKLITKGIYFYIFPYAVFFVSFWTFRYDQPVINCGGD